MVAVARNDDPSGGERVDQVLDGVRAEVGLVRDTDQRGNRRFRQGGQPKGDRAADSIFGMDVHDHYQRQPGQRISKRRLTRNDCHDRLKTGVQETARGFPDEQLASVRLEQLLTTESSR